MSDATHPVDPLPNKPGTRPPARAGANLTASGEQRIESIYLVSYPKIIFLYPSFFVTLIAGVASYFYADHPAHNIHAIMGTLFLGVLTINLVVLAFDFPRTNSLVLFFFVAALALAFALVMQIWPHLLPMVTGLFAGFKPAANATFYFSLATILGLIFAVVKLVTYFDYWEVRHNELLHHHGLLSDLKRYSAPSLRIDKEISDVFEYFLLRSGRLILQPSGEPRAIILDNVLFIESKEAKLTQLLGALQVQMQDPASPG